MPTRISLLIASFLAATMCWPAYPLERPAAPAMDAPDTPQVTEGFVNAPVAEVWRIFVTGEGIQAPEAGQTELRLGGRIRSHYPPDALPGGGGTIESEILAFEPERMLALRIKQVPDGFPFKDAIEHTWSVIYLSPADTMTHVRIVGLGYGQSPASQAMREFFADLHRATLDRIAKPYWPQCALCKKSDDAQDE